MALSALDVFKWIEDNIVWGIPVIILILTVGILLTIKLRALQVIHLGESLKYMVANETEGKGEVSSFAALCISMAATLGTGKIVGVATAIAIGGPGALFWMIIAAILGMATKYAEGFLAIRFRRKQEDGTYIGGPFTYIEDGMGKKWKWLAICFAIFGSICAIFGIGASTQMNSITDSFVSVFDPESSNVILTIDGHPVTLVAIIVGAVVTVLSAISIIGGIQRISKISVFLVPFMAIGYFLVCILILVFNITKVPAAVLEICKSAFNFKSATGGIAGMGIILAMRQGISKGIFSNEAGLGSAPIALASAKSNDSVRQGLVCMSGTFIDTMVLCLTIGLGIVLTGSYIGNEGVDITINAFQTGLNISQKFSAVIVMLAISTFAFTTIIGWNVYGEKCICYLTNNSKKALLIYKIIYISAVAIAPYFSLQLIWSIASICNGLMAIPNLIGLIVLSGLVAKETRDYFHIRKLQKQSEVKE